MTILLWCTLYLLLVGFLGLLANKKKKPSAPRTPLVKEGKRVSLSLVTTDSTLTSATILIFEDRLIVSSRLGTVTIDMSEITQILMEDKSNREQNFAGFCVDYSSEGKEARLMFASQSLMAMGKIKKIVGLIQAAHSAWHKGTNVPELPVADLTPTKPLPIERMVHRSL